MSRTLYLPPYKNWALFAEVTGVSPDTDHELAWLTDGRPGFPLRVAAGDGTIQLAQAAGPVTHVAICHHLLDEGLGVTVGGDTSGEIVIPAYGRNGIPFHAYAAMDLASPPTPDSVAALTLAISGNYNDILIGEVFAGEMLELDPSFRLDDLQFSIERFVNNPSGSRLSAIPPYSDRAEARDLSGSIYCSSLQDLGPRLEAVLDWWRSEDAYAYPVPSLLITNDEDPTSARVVTFAGKPTWREVEVAGEDPYYLIQLAFTEVPRTRW